MQGLSGKFFRKIHFLEPQIVWHVIGRSAGCFSFSKLASKDIIGHLGHYATSANGSFNVSPEQILPTVEAEHVDVSPKKKWVPQNGWFIVENPIKIDDLRVPDPYFWKHPCSSKIENRLQRLVLQNGSMVCAGFNRERHTLINAYSNYAYQRP